MDAFKVLSDEGIPLEPRTAGCDVPLTASQRRHWNGIGEGNRSSTRSVASASRVLGELRPDLLREALSIVVRRHESLRTRISTIAGHTIQEIDPPANDLLEVVDLSHMSQAHAEARRLAVRCAEEPIELSRGPLFRAALLKLSPQEHVLALTADHMVSDGMSSAILEKELWSAYYHLASGSAPHLPLLELQFGDYAVWQQRTYWTWRARHEAYWNQRLLGAPFVQLPLAGESTMEARSSAVRHIPFGKAVTNALREIGAKHRLPLPLIVLTIYACVMSRWCDQRDLPLIFVTHGRHAHKALRPMIAFLASCLHLRLIIERKDTFVDLLQKIACEHELAKQHYHFDRVWDFIPGCTTDLYFNWLPASPVASGVERYSGQEGVRIQSFPLGLSWQGKLHLFFSDKASCINVSVAYEPRIVTKAVIDQLERSLRAFARSFAQDTRACIASVKIGS